MFIQPSFGSERGTVKLSELRPCDSCGGIVAPQFYVVRSSLAIISPAANTVLGMTQMFRGHLALAEAMAPESECVKVAGEFNKELWIELRLCPSCYMGNINLAGIAERNSDREATKQSSQGEVK